MALTQISTQGIKDGTITGSDLATNVDLVDNQKLRLGNSNDLQIYHTGTRAIIKNDTGELDLFGDDIRFFSGDGGETLAKFIDNGAVELYHDNSKKFETTSTGATVTGTLTATSFSGETVVGDTSPQLGGNLDSNNQNILLPDSTGTNRIKFGTNEDLQIYHNGNNNKTYIGNKTSTDLLIENAGTNTDIVDDTGHYRARFIKDGAVELYHDNSKKFETTSGGAAITGTLTTTNAANSNSVFATTNNNTRASIELNGKDSSGNDVELRLAGFGDTNRGEIFTATNHAIGFATNNAAAQMTLDTSGNLNIVNDSGKIRLGASADLQIYHDGSISLIKSPSHPLAFYSNTRHHFLNGDGSEVMAVFTANGAVELYYDNVKRLETTHNSISVTGAIEFSTHIYGGDNNKVLLGHAQDMEIFHNGTDSVIRTDHDFKIEAKDGGKDMIHAIATGAVELHHNGSKKLHTTSSGITVTGSVTETSDIALKSDIQPITNSLEKIQQITGCKYNLENSTSPSMGVIAQDVEKVFPELVHGSEGNKTLQYSGLIGVLIEAVKDLSAEVAALKTA